MALICIVQSWLKSYFNNRKQYFRSKNNESSLRDVVLAVQQGSILGPLLFVVLTNDSFNVSDNLYSDDTTCYTTHTDTDILFDRTNIILKKLHYWPCLDKLSLNVNKLEYMLFSTNKKKD